MAFEVGQKVKVKSDSPTVRLTGSGVLTVIGKAGRKDTVLVKGETGGARWVRVYELEPARTKVRVP